MPTPNVSLIDFEVSTKKRASADGHQRGDDGGRRRATTARCAAFSPSTSQPLVSTDFNHNPASSTFDLKQTQVIDGSFVRVLSWYDNEWGFSNRMSDTAVALGKLG